MAVVWTRCNFMLGEVMLDLYLLRGMLSPVYPEVTRGDENDNL